MRMTSDEKELFKKFYNNNNVDDNVKNNIKYRFEMSNGDVFVVKYYGEGETEINPNTGEDDYFYELNFRIMEIVIDKSGKYTKYPLLGISKYDYPVSIVEL